MAEYNVGALHDSTVSYNNYNLNPGAVNDVFIFDVYSSFMGNREIGIRLHDISVGDDPTLLLWQDNNDNGVLDGQDNFIGTSEEIGNVDEIMSVENASGTYIAMVFYENSVGNVSYDLDLNATHSAGTLGFAVKSYNGGYLSNTLPTDVIEFEINSRLPNTLRTINVAVDNITNGGDVDLRLYKDDGNGVFDAQDNLVAAELFSPGEDSLNYRGTKGTYFAELTYDGSNSNFFNYDLKLSRTSSKASNLLVGEVDVGDLTGFGYSNNDFVSNSDTVDTYQFSLGLYEGVDITLTNLTDDADIRLIRDNNNDGIVDAAEVIAESNSVGVLDEQINNITLSGDYYLQVVKGPGDGIGPVGYTVDFNHFETPDA